MRLKVSKQASLVKAQRVVNGVTQAMVNRKAINVGGALGSSQTRRITNYPVVMSGQYQPQPSNNGQVVPRKEDSHNNPAFLNNQNRIMTGSRQSRRAVIVEEDIDFSKIVDRKSLNKPLSFAKTNVENHTSILYNQIPKQSNSSFFTTPKHHKKLTIISKENIDPADNTPFFAKYRPPLAERTSVGNS